MKYKVYAGLSGGFGGAYYSHTTDDTTEKQAEQDAWETACEIFDSQMGSGIESMNDLRENAESEIYRDEFENDEQYELAIQDYVEQSYEDLRESWIDYHVIEEGSDEEE